MKKVAISLILVIASHTVAASSTLMNHIHAAYQLPPENVTDLLIEVVKTDIFSRTNSKYIGEVLLSLYPVGREEYLDCQRFYSEIGEDREQIVKQKMESYLFTCTGSRYTEEQALEKFSNVLKAEINQPHEVDATWAWFSSTGNTEALKRFIENYLYNENSCKRCIEWSYSTNYKQNRDVYLYLKQYSMKVEHMDKLKLFRLAPRADEGNT